MTDLEAWAVLGLPEPDATLLLEAVEALVPLAPGARWPWLPRLLRHARHPSSPVRVAVLRALSGAGGLPVERAVLEGLSDGEPAVRAAAFEALAGLATVQGAAWLHAVCSPFVDVRQAAAERAPDAAWASWARLLADADSRDRVRARLDAAPRTERVPLLLEHLDEGHLAPAWLVAHLRTLPWTQGLDRLVAALPPARPVTAELLAGGEVEAVVGLLARPDGLDRVLGLLLVHGADPVFDALLQALLERELNPAAALRLAASALSFLTRGAALPPSLLALVAAHHPALLGMEDLPLAARRSALAALAPAARRVGAGVPLARMGGVALLTGPGGVDLRACSAVVALGQDGTLRQVVDAIGVSGMVDAVLADPATGAALLGRAYAGPDGVEVDRLIRLALQRGEGAAPLLGSLLVLSPARAVAALPRTAPMSLAGPAAVGADALLAPRGKEGQAAAAELAQALVQRLSTPARLLSAVLRDSDVSGPLVRQLVVKTLAAVSPSAAVSSLHAAGLARLARLDMEHGLLPDSVVVAFATAAARVDDPDVRAWLAPVTPAAPDPLLDLPPPGRRGALSRGLAFRLAHSLDDRLSALVEPALAAPRSGLCAVLAGRPFPSAPQPRVCAAVLLADDPLPLVAAQLHRSSHGDAACLRATTRLLAHGFAARADVGPGAALWLCAWPGPDAAARGLLAPPGACLALLADTLAWQGPALRGAAWRAVARELSRRRFQAPAALLEEATDPLVSLLVEVLVEGAAPGRGPLGFPCDAADRAAVQDAAAELLATLHAARRDLSAWALRVGLCLPELAPGTASRLAPWLSPRILHRRRPVITLRTPPVADLPTLVSVSHDLAELAALLDVEPPGAAECAAQRLCQLGPAGVQVLREAVLAGGPHARLLALALQVHGPEGALAFDEAVRAAAPPAARLALALARLDAGEGAPAAAQAAQAVADGAAPSPAELEAILAVDPLAAALRLWAAPDPAASGRAVAVLCEELAAWVARTPAWERDPLDPLPQVLGRFLLLGADRPHPARLLAARALLPLGARVGLPLLLAESMAKAREKNAAAQDWARGLPEDALVEATAAMMAAGAALCPTAAVIDGLLQPEVDLYGREPAALQILRDCREPKEQARVGPLLWLRRGRMLGTLRVADLFLWGRRQSRRLLGRALRIEMLAGSDLGWTRLDSPVIHVNPLPVLRGEAQGADIVRGLIVHELGHHLYNADAQGLACTKAAVAEGIGRLHNLVCDEHLERNLRTFDEGYGDDLKRLGAWAFQHARRGLPAELLAQRLGPRLVPVLVRAGLGPSRAPDQVSVGLGRLLGALEAHGSSFGRFVRALRMGRGDRHGDPKVEQALALFRADADGRSFRELDNEGLLEVSRALRRIFGDEAGVLDLCDLHGTAEPGEGEVLADGEGVTGGDVQREVDRAERAQQQRAGEGGGGRRGTGGPDILSTGPQTTFERIQKVTVLEYDAAAHRALAQDVVRPARQLREVLSRLGLSQVVVKPRVAGHRLDRGRLAALAIRRDPRVLISRRRIVDSDLFIGVVVDCSGSMSGGRMERARRFAALLAEACRGLPGVDLRLFGFTDRVIYDAGTAARCAAHALVANGGNNDAAGLYHASAEALRSARSARLLIMISDGLPTECTVAALTNLVQQLERRHGMACAQVAVHPISQRCFTDYVEVLSDDVAIAARDFGRVVQRLVTRTMRG